MGEIGPLPPPVEVKTVQPVAKPVAVETKVDPVPQPESGKNAAKKLEQDNVGNGEPGSTFVEAHTSTKSDDTETSSQASKPTETNNKESATEQNNSNTEQGKPMETTQANEISEQQKKENEALEEMARLLLDQKDPRVSIVALARAAGEGKMTAMGKELRQEVIRVLQQDKKLAKDSAAAKIKELTVPEKSETPAFEEFLKANKDLLPQDGVPRLILEINSGRLTIGDLARKMQASKDSREPFLTALLGEDRPPLSTTEDMLNAAHIEVNKKNLKQWDKTYEPKTPIKTRLAGFGRRLPGAALVLFMLMQFGLSIQQESAQSHRS